MCVCKCFIAQNFYEKSSSVFSSMIALWSTDLRTNDNHSLFYRLNKLTMIPYV